MTNYPLALTRTQERASFPYMRCKYGLFDNAVARRARVASVRFRDVGNPLRAQLQVRKDIQSNIPSSQAASETRGAGTELPRISSAGMLARVGRLSSETQKRLSQYARSQQRV
jgi:hypothetical protein